MPATMMDPATRELARIGSCNPYVAVELRSSNPEEQFVARVVGTWETREGAEAYADLMNRGNDESSWSAALIETPTFPVMSRWGG